MAYAPLDMVIVHHTVRPHLYPDATIDTELEAVRAIERHHVEVNGWNAVGYSFLVAPSGTVFEGRGWSRRGAHCPGWNGKSIGLALIIDGTKDEPPPAMIDSARALLAYGVDAGHLFRDYTVHGHRDHRDTECPGDLVYARLRAFKA